MLTTDYSAVCGNGVSDPVRERRDCLLAIIRTWQRPGVGNRRGERVPGWSPPLTSELVGMMVAAGIDYSYGMCMKDLAQLERYGLVRPEDWPFRWTARR